MRDNNKDNRKLLTIRLPRGLHKAVKLVALDKEITIQDYILDLIAKDIEKIEKIQIELELN